MRADLVFIYDMRLISWLYFPSWHKVRVKPASSQEVEGPEGLVPAAYIEKVDCCPLYQYLSVVLD